MSELRWRKSGLWKNEALGYQIYRNFISGWEIKCNDEHLDDARTLKGAKQFAQEHYNQQKEKVNE